MKVRIRPHQRKGIKINAPLRRNPVIQLSDTAAAKISWVLILRLRILDFPVDLLKTAVGNHGLSTQNQLPLIRNGQRYIAEHPGIVGNNLAHLAVSSCHRFLQSPVRISQNNGQPVQFP